MIEWDRFCVELLGAERWQELKQAALVVAKVDYEALIEDLKSQEAAL
jgi:hypothetical protein